MRAVVYDAGVRLHLQHRSRYQYATPAQLGPHTLRLHPAPHTRARVETYRLIVEPSARMRWYSDPFGNRVARVDFAPEETLTSFEVVVELAVQIEPVNPFDFLLEPMAETAPFAYPAALARELQPFLALDDPAYAVGPLFEAFEAALPRAGETVPLLDRLNQEVHDRVRYVIREETGTFTPEQSLMKGQASCRDSSLLLSAVLRRRGFATRFVSGYLVQLVDEGMLPDQPRGMSRDVVDLHAWCEVYLPGAGWVGLDATSGLFCGEGHIPLCCAAAPELAAPIEGTSDTPASDVGFSMAVQRLGHEARPTMPYSDDTWAALQHAGEVTDAHLLEAGVRLTMGGEPTFNAREAGALPEWNGDALGASKWERGLELAGELRRRLAAGAVTLLRQGKHYPGESLPRWALEIIARSDGVPIWSDHPSPSRKPTPDDVERFARALAKRLDVTQGLQPAHEDPWILLKEDAALPVGIDAKHATLDDSAERQRLARTLARGVGAAVGWVLPLVDGGTRWQTESWTFRRGALFLLPGDSPVGLRLPLGALPKPKPRVPAEPALVPPDPRREAELAQRKQLHRAAPVAAAGALTTDVRTALCVEARNGVLWAFVPPQEDFDAFCRLVRAIDETRIETGLEASLEGYAPPRSDGQLRIAVTPDPGVLEVNLPPCSSMREYEALVMLVFDAALRSGLHAEKYLTDGRMAGSGGGHHLTFGGAEVLASPFLRRPDLLASLVTFTQHHPSLSYLFSGLFVGPTSQAPRVDEARHESLYELEIALARAHERGDAPPPPWLGDILFRNLLVDITGNTHRAEISIDKLFDPGTSFGRQGLVELRAIEMPPHPRMLVAQMLLWRTLLAAFATAPYRAPLQRFGMGLHDRFLLPYFLWRDLEDVLEYVDGHALGLPAAGYRPCLELRCPLVGRMQAGDVALEVRNALEPWNVLGEEHSGTGTSRYVDSSMERIEIRAQGLQPDRHLVLANGRRLPMHATGEAGLHVAGVRFKAWSPPHSLHPHIEPQHPIRIDVVDLWARRSLGGCAYHVWHPEGRAYDAPPLTRFEAGARRAQRFTLDGPSPWPVTPIPTEPSVDAPLCLDLRRPVAEPLRPSEAA